MTPGANQSEHIPTIVTSIFVRRGHFVGQDLAAFKLITSSKGARGHVVFQLSRHALKYEG